MNNLPHLEPDPGPSREFLSVIGWVGAILIFVLILWLAYLPYRPAPVDQATVDRRFQIKAEVDAAQQQLISSYAVIDPNNGIYRIPIERAMELTVQRLQQEQSAAAAP